MKIEVRGLCREDIERVARIEEASFSMPWSAGDFEDLLSRNYCTYVVGIVDGVIAGCSGYTNICGEANIDNVVVDTAYRGLGVAQAMLTELFRLGEEQQVEAYTLEVRVSNEPAIHVYEKLGFVSEGIRPGFYDKPKEDANIMWKRL